MTAIDGNRFLHVDINHRLFVNNHPTLLHILAKRVGEVPTFDNMNIQQNFYAHAWVNGLPPKKTEDFIYKLKSLVARTRIFYKPAAWLYHGLGLGNVPQRYDVNKALKSFA